MDSQKKDNKIDSAIDELLESKRLKQFSNLLIVPLILAIIGFFAVAIILAESGIRPPINVNMGILVGISLLFLSPEAN